MKSLKNLVGAGPEKKKKSVPLKPPGVVSKDKLRRVRVSELLERPSSGQLLSAVFAALLGVALLALCEAAAVSASSSSLSALASLLPRAMQSDGCRPSFARRQPSEPLPSLHCALAARRLSLSLPQHWEPIAAARALLLLPRASLYDTAQAIRLLHAAQLTPPNCANLLQQFRRFDNGTAAYADEGRAPSLRLTLHALQALAACNGATDPDVPAPDSEIAAWVLQLQQDDGGFAAQEGMPSSLVATWRAVLILGNSIPDDARIRALHYVQSCSAPDGGFSDRPQALLERVQRYQPSLSIPSLRGAHALALLQQDHKLPRAVARFSLQLQPHSPSTVYALLQLLDVLPGTLPFSAVHVTATSIIRSIALVLIFIVAPHAWLGAKPKTPQTVLASALLAAAWTYELQLSVVAVACGVVALLVAIYLITQLIPFNDQGEELLYISIASAAATAGLFFALGYTSPDIFVNIIVLYVFGVWAPFCSYLCCYVAELFVSRSLTYFVAATYAAWLLVLALIPFLLYRRGILDVVLRLVQAQGHFSSLLAGLPAVTLFASFAVALLANVQ